jgi:hypothetical protein
VVDNKEIKSIVEYDEVSISQEISETITDITDQELEMLLEASYLPASVDVKKVKVREVVHAQVGYLTFVVPWGNDQAELRYRRQLDQQ